MTFASSSEPDVGPMNLLGRARGEWRRAKNWEDQDGCEI
jgi:hypothetical protein